MSYLAAGGAGLRAPAHWKSLCANRLGSQRSGINISIVQVVQLVEDAIHFGTSLEVPGAQLRLSVGKISQDLKLAVGSMPSDKFAPGFRLSMLDSVVLAAGTIATIGLATVVWWWGFLVGFVIGHFFLFCNVVRMGRPLELTWAVVFLALAAPTVINDKPGWLATASLSLVVTVVVVALEMRKPSYHGLGWQWINPALPAWWESKAAEHRGE